MTHHDLKMWSGHFQHVVDGDMRADMRHTRDRDFAVGDSATFHEIDTADAKTGRTISCRISYVGKHGVLPDHVNLSLKDVGLLVIK